MELSTAITVARFALFVTMPCCSCDTVRQLPSLRPAPSPRHPLSRPMGTALAAFGAPRHRRGPDAGARRHNGTMVISLMDKAVTAVTPDADETERAEARQRALSKSRVASKTSAGRRSSRAG